MSWPWQIRSSPDLRPSGAGDRPGLAIAGRSRGARQRATLRQIGVRRVADPEVEAGVELARHALQRMGVSGPELAAIASGLRRSQYGPDPVLGGGGRSD